MSSSIWRRVAASAVAVILVACDSDPAGPSRPAGPDTDLLLKRTVSYFADIPANWQAGDYFYDSHGRLERFEHTSTYTGTPRTTIRKEYIYQVDGRPLGHDSSVNLDGEWYFNRAVRYSYQGNSPHPVEVQLTDTDESTGEVVTEAWGLGYDQHGRLVEIRKGPVTETLTYDSRGDVIRAIRRDDTHAVTFEQSLTYTGAWNPFARLPVSHGAFSGIVFPGEHSLHLASRFETGVQGQPPATKGAATVVMNAHGYPTRWEITFWNTNDPDNTSTVVTEFEYHDNHVVYSHKMSSGNPSAAVIAVERTVRTH